MLYREGWRYPVQGMLLGLLGATLIPINYFRDPHSILLFDLSLSKALREHICELKRVSLVSTLGADYDYVYLCLHLIKML